MNLLNRKVNRRTLLQSAGVGALSLGLGLKLQVKAQDMSGAPLALQTFSVGDASLTALREANFELPANALGGGAEEGAVSELLASRNLPAETYATGTTPLLVTLGEDIILFDSGTGQNTVASVEAAGVDPADLTRVVFTHWHGDHVGGASAEGALNFPNATYHFPEIDWDFLQGADDENAQGSLASLQPAEDAGVLELYSAGELLPGLEAIHTPGHTPGHHSLLLTSGDQSLMFIGDVFVHPVTALVNPDWAFQFDADPELAATTRRDLLGRLAEDGTRVLAYHFPFPGTGYVSREGNVFEFSYG